VEGNNLFIFLGFAFGNLEVSTPYVSKAINLLPSPVNNIESTSTCVLKTERIGEDNYENRSIF